jgi:hypothetical protein
VTVEANEGYTISKCVFNLSNGSDGTTLTISTPPFKINFVWDDDWGIYYCEGTDKDWTYDRVTSIQVYTNKVDVTGINLDKTEASMTVGGDALTLIPTVLPAEATDKSVTWTSSDEAVATVTDGVVTAVAAGTATITVTTTDGAKTATCAVTVAAPAPSTYTVTLKEGTEDATSWTIAPAEATTTGVAAGTEVTASYKGTKKVKSVKAVKKAAAGNPAPTTASIEDYTAGTFGWDGDGSAATGLPTINTFAANDKISILSAKNTNTQFTTSAGGASADFTGTATDDSKFYAVYPYTDGLALSGDVISGIVIPTSQWNSGWNSDSDFSGWDPKAPIAYATTTGSSLTFHNACAILKVTFPMAFTYGRFTISANEPLAGTFSLDTSTGTLTPTSGSTTVTVGNPINLMKGICTDGNGKTVYVAIAPGTYTGFNLHIYNENDKDKSKTKSSVTFEAGKIYDLGSYDLGNL